MESVFDQFDKPKMAELIDWKFISLDKDLNSIRLSFNCIEDFTNPTGKIHGGFITSMLDECMGSAVVGISEAQNFATTISLHVDFIRPVSVGLVYGEGVITHMGKNIVFLESKIWNEDNVLLARASGSYKLHKLLQDE